MTDLIPSIEVDRVLATRNAVLAKIERALALLLEADRDAVQAGFGSHWRALGEGMGSSAWSRDVIERDNDPTPHILALSRAALDAGGWEMLLEKSGLKSYLDSQTRHEWAEHIAHNTTPPLEPDHVLPTFQRIHEDRHLMVEEGVVQLFRALSWNYKSNLPVRFGRRLVIERLFQSTNAGWFVDIRSGNHLDDLMRVLLKFDGKPEPDYRNGASAWACKSDLAGAPWEGYFALKRFKNGNGHVLFEREDLVDRLNQILARYYPGALPAPA